jgi:ribonuclease BN (tRNA processing enzyme)
VATLPDGLEFTVLGAGPAYSDRADALGSAYLLEHAGHAIVLDLGQGTFSRLASARDPASLDAVVVSHLHPDHFIDLVPLRHYLRWETRPTRRCRVIGPAGLDERLDALHAADGFFAAALDLEPLRAGSRTVGPFVIEARRVTHTKDSHGFRVSIDDRAGLVYSGDCGRAEDLEPLIRPGDVLLSEVSFGPGPVPVRALHLDGPAVGALAARTGVARVLLTHLQMGHDRAATIASVRQHFSGPVDLLRPGWRTAIV